MVAADLPSRSCIPLLVSTMETGLENETGRNALRLAELADFTFLIG